MGLNEITDIIQSDCSFVSYEGGIIIILLHIPVYKAQTELSAYEYLNIPITTTDNNTTISILPPKPIIAINLQNELFIELTNYELTHSCKRIKERYFCEQKAVVKRPQHKTCLTSLFRQNNDEIFKTCSIQLTNINEQILQLNTSTFLIYSKTEKQIFVTCIRNDEKVEKQFTLKDLTYLIMENKCTAILDNSIITSNLPFNYDIYQKFTKIDIDFKSVLGLENEEFSKFITANWRNEKKPIKLSDIKKLYHIEKLQTHNQTLWDMFKKFALACVGILLIFVTLKITKYLWKCSKQSKMKSNQQMNVVEMRHVFDKNVSENSTLNETMEPDEQSNTNVSQERIIQFPA